MRRAFTLVELCLVLVILSLLAGIGFWGLVQWRQLDDNTRMQQDLLRIHRAKMLWRMDHEPQQFPDVEASRWQSLQNYLKPAPQPPAGWVYLINDLMVYPMAVPSS